MSRADAAPAVLLVSGAAEDDELWTDVLAQLPDAKTLTLPNSSDLGVLSESVLVGLRDAIRDSGGNGRGVLVGHSLGGATCVIAASAVPAIVGGVVVVASGTSMPVHRSLWEILEEEGEASVIRRFATASAGGSATQYPGAQDISERMLAMMQRANPGTLTNHLKACDAYHAPTVSVAATVVAGASDRLVSPVLAEQLSQRIGAGYDLLAGVGHQIPWEAPDSIVSAIQNLPESK